MKWIVEITKLLVEISWKHVLSVPMDVVPRGLWIRRGCRLIDKYTAPHVPWKCSMLCLCLPSAGFFQPLDAVRDFDHQVGFGHVWMVTLSLGHCLVCRFLDLRLMAIFDIVVERTSMRIATVGPIIAEVPVVCNVLGADVTSEQLVAALRPTI
jgi:hypothetical protein